MSAPIAGPGTRQRTPECRRTHDPAEIEAILRADAFDAPIPYLSTALLRRAVRDLLAPSARVFFIVAEVERDYAGFVFAHTLGPTFWRAFAREQLPRHPLAVAWLIVRLKLLRPLHWRLRRLRAGMRKPVPVSSSVGSPRVAVPRLDRPFTWSAARPDIGQLDQIYVRDEHRGLGVAPRLLEQLKVEMRGTGISLVEAHVDGANQPSVRAFLKGGWEAYEMAGGDYYVCWKPSVDADALS